MIGPGRVPGIGLDMELDDVDALGRGLVGIGGDLHHEARPLQLQRRQLGHDGARTSASPALWRLVGESCGRRRHRRLGNAKSRIQLLQLLFAGVEIGEIGNHPHGQRRKRRHRHRIFARGGAQRKQPLLDPLQFLRIVFGLAERRLHCHLRIGELIERRVEQLHGVFEQARRLMALALQPAHQRGDMRHGRGIAVQEFGGFGDIDGDALGLHHPRAAVGKIVLLAILRRQLFQFLDRSARR